MDPSLSGTIFNMIFLVSSAIAILYISTRSRWFVNILLSKEKSRKSIGIMILAGGILQILSLEFSISFPNGAMADIRISLAILFGIIGGPAVGIPVGLIGGAYRMSGLLWEGFRGTLGYTLAVGGGINAIGAGLVGGLLNRRGITMSTIKTRSVLFTISSTLLWILVGIELIDPMTAPFFSEMNFTEAIYFTSRTILVPIMVANLFAITVFMSVLNNVVMEEKKKRVLQKLVKKYEALIGPVAGRIAKETAKEENYPLEDLKFKGEEK